MDQYCVTAEDMESWEVMYTKRDERPLLVWTIARQDRENYVREVGLSFHTTSGQKHLPPVELP